MNLIAKEVKDNFKSTLVWMSIIAALILMVVIIHPLAVQKMDMMDEMLKQFPPELMKALNISGTTFDNILSYFFYEFQFILVAGSIFAGILGANMIAKEESDKTIQFIYSKPISRRDILLGKVVVTLLYLIAFNVILCAMTGITMAIVSNQYIDYLLLFNIFSSQLLIQITFAFVGMLMAVLLPKPKIASAITGGIVVISFIIGMISKIADKVSSLHYVSIIDYLLNDKFIDLGYMEIKYIVIMVIIIIGSLMSSLIMYNKKEFKI
jgi:ABC-2 type transport system permease protein